MKREKESNRDMQRNEDVKKTYFYAKNYKKNTQLVEIS